MSLLTQFMQEYDELCYKNLGKDGTGDILQEIKQAEKIIHTPKLHPTTEIKQYYKQLKEQYKSPLHIHIVGDCHQTMVVLLNVLLKDSLIPLHNALTQKKFILRYSPHFFTTAHYKNTIANVNLHTLDCSSSHLDEIEYFEMFLPMPLLQECTIIKESDCGDKKRLAALKDCDIILWVLHKLEKLKVEKLKKEELAKIINKKPTIAILAHNKDLKKEGEEERITLEQISTQRKQLDTQLNLYAIYDIHLWNLLESYRLDEKFTLCKIIGTLHKQQLTSKVRTLEAITSSLDQTKSSIESFYAQKGETKQDSAQHTIMNNLTESLQEVLQTATTKRGIALLKNALERNKTMDKHYKILFGHYKKLDIIYHKAGETLSSKIAQLISEYNQEIFVTIAKGLKRYFDSIVESIVDNIEFVRIKTRPNQPTLLDIITNRRIVYDSFQLHKDELLREIDDPTSLLARKNKSLLSKLIRLDSYMTQSTNEIMRNFDEVLHEWATQGHRLILQKKPSYISSDSYVNLEEFQLRIFQTFTKRHHSILNDFMKQVHTKIATLSVWVQATRGMLLECVILRIDQKFHADKANAKQNSSAQATPITREFIEDCIVAILPQVIEEIFCSLPSAHAHFNSIPNELLYETKENEKIVRNKIREIMDLRQTLKSGTKILENAIEYAGNTPTTKSS